MCGSPELLPEQDRHDDDRKVETQLRDLDFVASQPSSLSDSRGFLDGLGRRHCGRGSTESGVYSLAGAD